MLIIGNPKPMPEETVDCVGAVFESECVEVAPGMRFDCCTFKDCEFHGVGPVLFLNCVFEQEDCHECLDHGHYQFCTFMRSGFGASW